MKAASGRDRVRGRIVRQRRTSRRGSGHRDRGRAAKAAKRFGVDDAAAQTPTMVVVHATLSWSIGPLAQRPPENGAAEETFPRASERVAVSWGPGVKESRFRAKILNWRIFEQRSQMNRIRSLFLGGGLERPGFLARSSCNGMSKLCRLLFPLASFVRIGRIRGVPRSRFACDDLANQLHDVILHGLKLCYRVAAGDRPHLGTEQAKLKGMLGSGSRPPRGEANPTPPPPSASASRIAASSACARPLACWLDEILIDAGWREWDENKLESALYRNEHQLELLESGPTRRCAPLRRGSACVSPLPRVLLRLPGRDGRAAREAGQPVGLGHPCFCVTGPRPGQGPARVAAEEPVTAPPLVGVDKYRKMMQRLVAGVLVAVLVTAFLVVLLMRRLACGRVYPGRACAGRRRRDKPGRSQCEDGRDKPGRSLRIDGCRFATWPVGCFGGRRRWSVPMFVRPVGPWGGVVRARRPDHLIAVGLYFAQLNIGPPRYIRRARSKFRRSWLTALFLLLSTALAWRGAVVATPLARPAGHRLPGDIDVAWDEITERARRRASASRTRRSSSLSANSPAASSSLFRMLPSGLTVAGGSAPGVPFSRSPIATASTSPRLSGNLLGIEGWVGGGRASRRGRVDDAERRIRALIGIDQSVGISIGGSADRQRGSWRAASGDPADYSPGPRREPPLDRGRSGRVRELSGSGPGAQTRRLQNRRPRPPQAAGVLGLAECGARRGGELARLDHVCGLVGPSALAALPAQWRGPGVRPVSHRDARCVARARRPDTAGRGKCIPPSRSTHSWVAWRRRRAGSPSSSAFLPRRRCAAARQGFLLNPRPSAECRGGPGG